MRHSIQGRMLGEHRASILLASKPHCRTAAQNRATSNATDLPRAKRNTSSSTQVTDIGRAAFISCIKPHHLVGFFSSNSWNLLTPISVRLCSSLHSSGAQTTKYPERYFLIMGAFCQILCSSFPVWITAFKLVAFTLASPLLQSQCSPKKEFTEN